MSARSNPTSAARMRHLRAHLTFALSLVLVSGSVGCWEQWSESWFPQMKWQKAVQAFERVQHPDKKDPSQPQINPFMPPDGAVEVGAEGPVFEQYDPAADGLVNPTRPDATQPIPPQSWNRGKVVYQIYCTTCHGPQGMGDGPVSMANAQKPGPFAGVFPLVTAASRSDGYIYNLIRGGGLRMPSYQRIPPEDRWHLVNYVRHLQQGGQP